MIPTPKVGTDGRSGTSLRRIEGSRQGGFDGTLQSVQGLKILATSGELLVKAVG